MYSNREVPVHPDVFSGTASECCYSSREGQFTVSQVCIDSFYLQGFKLGVIQVVDLGNYSDLPSITTYK